MEQVQQPLAFMSGQFKVSHLCWTIYVKESFAISETFYRLDYIMMCKQDTRNFTNHLNLIFVFSSSEIQPRLSRHKFLKVLRCNFILSHFMYHIKHVDGKRGIMADIMTMWVRGYRGHSKAIKLVTHLFDQQDIVGQPLEPGLDWPTVSAIQNSQLWHTA